MRQPVLELSSTRSKGTPAAAARAKIPPAGHLTIDRPSSSPPARMETAATSYPVAREPPARPPPQTAQLGQGEPRWRVWARRAVPVVLLVAVTAGFAGAVYRARHSGRDLAFVITTYYLIALLYCCLRKLELMPSPLSDPAGAAAWEPERRRARLAVWIVSVALGNTFALRIADAMPNLALKLTVWVLTAVGMSIAFYFIFRRRDGERRPQELSPEQRV